MDEAKRKMLAEAMIRSPVMNPELADHATLYGARMQGDMDQNIRLAPYEHQAFAREYVESNPVVGPIAMALLTAGYTPAKALGIIKTDEKTTPPSIEQMLGGFRGIGQGVMNNVRKVLS